MRKSFGQDVASRQVYGLLEQIMLQHDEAGLD